MGRRKLEIWELFETVVPKSGSKPHPDVECKYCHVVLKNAQPSGNVLSHTLECAELPKESKTKYLQLDEERRIRKAERRQELTRAPSVVATEGHSPAPAPAPREREPEPSVASPPPTKRRRTSPSPPPLADVEPQPQRTRPLMECTPEVREENFYRVAAGFYSAGLPPHAIENPNFRDLFDYEVPTRQELVELLRSDRVREMVEGSKPTGKK
ncbi:hypothetical protein PHYBOEH_005719 [Phytophthora boehmeriae]|uniref:BED-type domain-containing protein n=1 Tax=Phytophthora boehmeriae TaxID=109152 RepID=A0A8T1X8J5_9STRA|nr:hypothetical protein PHYBOEH_005719 [Phytophthora boehmeriae]